MLVAMSQTYVFRISGRSLEGRDEEAFTGGAELEEAAFPGD